MKRTLPRKHVFFQCEPQKNYWTSYLIFHLFLHSVVNFGRLSSRGSLAVSVDWLIFTNSHLSFFGFFLSCREAVAHEAVLDEFHTRPVPTIWGSLSEKWDPTTEDLMDIEEFIQTTLTQIIDGVKKAQDDGVKKAQDATRLQGETWRRRRHG